MITCKWPGLIARGESVEPDLAAEIIIRTTLYPVSTNYHEFDFKIAKRLDLLENDLKHPYVLGNTNFDKLRDFNVRNNILNLEYLGNSQIGSSYVGGPHGWISWDGKIETTCYNVGKWPSSEQIHKECELVAKTFPQLTVVFELIDREWFEERDEPAQITDMFELRDGKVVHTENLGELSWDDYNPSDDMLHFERMLKDPSCEYGISIEELFSHFDRLNIK